MEGNRDSRRGMVAVVSGGLSRRRLRNSSRDSPDESAARLKDRGSEGGGKMDRYRDRDISGLSKRRRPEKVLHVSSNRDDDDDESSEDSLDGEDDDVTIRFPLPSHPPPAANPSSSSTPQQQSNHHHYHKHHSQSQQHQRKSFPKLSKPPLGWKGDDMIGVTVPRKARSAVKRSHEYWVLDGACGVEEGEERIARQFSKSPVRLSPASTTTTTHISPSSSDASLRKKMKPMSGRKQLPTKISRASSSSAIQDDIEIEVAEVLFGMTRQEVAHKVDTRELDGASSNEARSRVSSPSSISPFLASNPSVLHPNSASHTFAAPKRKKARPVKVDDESPASSPAERAVSNSFMPSAVKLEAENVIKTVASLQNSTPQVGDGGDSAAAEIIDPPIAAPHLEAQPEATKLDERQVPDFKMSTGDRMNCKDEDSSASHNLDVKLSEATTLKKAPPPGKLSPDEEDPSNMDSAQKPAVPEAEMRLKAITKTKDQEMLPVEQAAPRDSDEIVKSASKKQMTKEHSPNLGVDLERASKDDNGKSQIQKQQQKTPKVEHKQEKSAPTTAMNMPMTVGAWQGGFPPFGYMGQVPSLQGVIPMDGPTVTSNALPPSASIAQPSRQKRCATHFYIAQTIHYYQKLASMNPFWSAATANSIYGAKPYSLNDMPPSDSDATLFTNPMQAAVSGFDMSSLHDAKIGASAYAGQHPSADKKATTNNPMIEVAQRKQTPHSGSTTNMLHAPAFIFPINQQQAADGTPTINGADATKSIPWPGNLVAPAGASSSAAGSFGSIGALTPMTLSFSGLPMGDAQYLAMMQNNPYPFPLPSHIAGSSPFRGTAPPQAMPYFLPSHMLRPTHIQPLQQQLSVPSNTPHAQQNHQKMSKCNESSSSQKHVQQSNLGSGLSVAGTNSHGFPASKQRQHAPPQNACQDSDKGSEKNPSASESRDSRTHNGMYGQSFAIINHHQNLMSSTAVASVAGSGGHGDQQMKSQQPQQKKNVKLDHTSPPAFTMPFTSLSGTGVVLPGRELSSQSQNHAIFQTLPEVSRHGHHQIAMTAKVAESKKHTTDVGKSVVRESVNGTMTAEDEEKAMADNKTAGNGLQHSLIFSKLGGEANGPISSVLNNTAMDISSPALNVIQAPANGSRTVNPLGGSNLTSNMPMGSTNIPSLQHQQQMLQFQNQQQEHQLSSPQSKNSVSTNSSSAHSNHLSGCSTVVKFPQPQAVMQDGIHSKIKATSGRSSALVPGTSSAPPIHKSNLVHQQVRSAQWPLPAESHQTQISFGMNSVKVVPAAGQHFSGVSSSSAGTTAVGSASNSTCKNGDGSSPRAPTSAKPAPAMTGGPHLQQSSSKNAPASSSTSKQFPVGGIPSILGHPQNTAGNSTTKLQQQQQLPQSLKQQSFPQAQFCFTNAYMQQPHTVQSNAATTTTVATGYYQKLQADQATQQTQQQQLTSVSRSSGMVALPISGVFTSDPARAMAAAGNATNTKAMSQSTLLHPPQFTVVHSAPSGSRARALVPAPFTYMSKPAPGGDNLNASWQPKKR